MLRKWFILFLLAGSFLISCKTAPAEDVSESPAVTAEGAPREEIPVEEKIVEDIAAEAGNTVDTTDLLSETTTLTAAPETEELPRQVLKTPSRSGGMKTRTPVQSNLAGPAAETGDPEMILPGDASDDSLLEPPADMNSAGNVPSQVPLTASGSESVPEISLSGETPLPGQTEIPFPEEPVTSSAADSAGLPPASGLPSDIETNSYNPLLPVVIVPGNPPSGMESSPSGNRTAEKSSSATGGETMKSTSVSPSVPLKANQDSGSINSSQTSATTEIPVSQPSAAMDSDVYSLSADLSGKLIIFLEGAGWIYLSSSTDGISLRDKSYDPASGRTRFVFSGSGLRQSGVELIFLKQDLLRGESFQQSLILDDGNNPLLAGEKTNPAPVENSPAMTVPGRTPVSDATGVGSAITDEQSSPDKSSPAGLSSGMTVSEPVTVAEETTFPPVGLNPSELLELAGKFENPGPEQSLEKAIILYEKLRSEFPVTEERFIAEERIRYLNKHYFKVQ